MWALLSGGWAEMWTCELLVRSERTSHHIQHDDNYDDHHHHSEIVMMINDDGNEIKRENKVAANYAEINPERSQSR